MIKDNVDHLLDVLIMAFGKILVLLICFTLPCFDKESMQNFLDAFADLNLSSITNELGRCTSLSDVIHEGTGEVSRGFHPIYI